MSYLTEKMAYIRGLAEGLEIDEKTKEGKLLKAIVEALSDTADELCEISDVQEEMQQQLDEVDEDLEDLEDFVYGDCDEDYDEDDEYYDDDDEFGIECPNCHDMIYLDPDMLDECEDTIVCPSCNEEINLEFDCDCGGNCDKCGE